MQSHIIIPWVLSTLDWIVFIAVLGLTVAAVMYGNNRKKSKKTDDVNFLDLLLMGRRLTLPLFICTLVATWYGGIVGVTAIAFEKGFYNFLTQGIFWYITYLIFALFFVTKIRNTEAKTLPETAELFFGPKARTIVAIINFTNVLPIAYAISAGILIQLITGFTYIQSLFIGILFVLVYSNVSGLRSVVYSDLIQFFVMCSSVMIVIVFSFIYQGSPFSLTDKLPDHYFNLIGNESWASALVWLVIALTTLVDPNFHQRCLAAASPKVAKKGIFISTGVWIIFDLCTTFGALYAKAAIPNAIPNQAYLNYSIQLLPHGFKGYFLAGMIATIFSTMDSYFFLASASVNYDLLKGKWRNPKLYKPLAILIAAGTFFLCLGFQGNIASIWKFFGSLSAAVILIPMVCAYIKPDFYNDNDFLFSASFGLSGVILGQLQLVSAFEPLYLGLVLSATGLHLRTIIKKAGLNSSD